MCGRLRSATLPPDGATPMNGLPAFCRVVGTTKPAIGFDKNAPRESLNYIGAYTGVMASSSLKDPADMSPADLGTAKAYGERFAKDVATGNSPLTPYRDFTTE